MQPDPGEPGWPGDGGGGGDGGSDGGGDGGGNAEHGPGDRHGCRTVESLTRSGL